REFNPNIIILAYVSSQEIMNEPGFLPTGSLREKLLNNIYAGWWLKDLVANKISFWPGTAVLNLSDGAQISNLGQRFNDYLPDFVNQEIRNSGLWDGVFYDNLWGDICWLNSGRIDINNSGAASSCAEMNKAWADGVKKMLSRSRSLFGEKFIIAGNGQVYSGYYPYLNGLMLENFPPGWANNGDWLSSINNYFNLDSNIARQPQVNVVNRACSRQEDYGSLRFGLANALLGDAYFSADRGALDHSQMWWYDEYNINLGEPRSKAYRLFSTSTDLKTGLWRRDFDNGLTLVNSGAQNQKIIFSKEELERIKGQQDTSVNNGQRVTWLNLAPGEGLILLKAGSEILDSNFNNGNFVRVYDAEGQMLRNGFFSYLPNFAGDQEIITVDINNDNQLENIVSYNGKIEIYRQGKLLKSLAPYGPKYKGRLAFAYDQQNIIVGAGSQVEIFDLNFKLRGIFSVKNQGQMNLAAAADKIVITSNDPQIRVYNRQGKLETEIIAYDSKWRGGINIALGDVNNDGQPEIVTGPAAGLAPELNIFSLSGNLIGQFMAYDKDFKKGIKPSLADVNHNGRLEILVGIKNF
ncbi:MAG: putative glycoside hydrolase, partial [Candidatus Falkowbacteria bacterium]|nr:putative glycoside hydrolase [Candidatus Falkowbacteria bacterium]